MPMHQYVVGGRTAATAGTINQAACNLWNPHATLSLFVKQIWICSTAATASNLAINRSTNRGTTPGSTVTPDIDNDIDFYVAPTSGALLDLAAWATYPTLAAPPMHKWNLPAVIGAGMVFVFDPYVKVGPSNGLAVYTPVAAAIPISDVTYIWEE